MAISNDYHQYLIESLKDKTEAATYLWAILQEEKPESQLLEMALNNILEALGDTNLSIEEITLHKAEINKFSNKSGIAVIYGLAQWLQKLGLELTVNVSDKSLSEENQSNHNVKAFI